MKNAKKYLENFLAKAAVFAYLNLAKPTSLFFRRVFEFKKIKESVGILVLAFTLITSVAPAAISAIQIASEDNHKLTNKAIEITTQQSLQKPVESFRLTKYFSFFHPGLDFATDAGSAVLPILPGEVEKVERSRFGYGNYIIINHGSGFKSLYAHFVKIAVKEGQEVDKNTVIGFIGSTGWSTGPHLHLEIVDNGQKINPKTLFEDYLGKKLASSRWAKQVNLPIWQF